MTDIIETSNFPGTVPLLEIGDKVEGGVSGAANKQAIALTSRTRYLKDNQDIIFSGANLANGFVRLDANGKIPSSFIDMVRSSYLVVADEAERLALPTSPDLQIVVQVDEDTLYYLNGDLDPSISSNWFKGQSATVNGVAKVFGRTGNITAEVGDYTADQIAETASRAFVNPTDKAAWNAKQEALVTGVNIKSFKGFSLLGAGDFNPTPQQLGCAEVVHLHLPADITGFNPSVSNVVKDMFEAGPGTSIGYNLTTNKLTISMSNPAPETEAYVSIERATAIANETVSFSVENQSSFSMNAFALKKIVGEDNTLRTNTYNNDDGYIRTDQIIYSPNATIAGAVTLPLVADGVLFSAIYVPTKGKKTNIVNSGKMSIIPRMTANNTPTGYTAIASSNNGDPNAGSAIYKAFDKSNATPTDAWSSNALPTTGSPQWIGIHLPQAIRATSYAITTRNQANYSNSPNTWRFQGSNDGTNWTDLHSVTGDTANIPNQIRSYEFANTVAYSYYRLLITGCNTGTLSTFVTVGELDVSVGTKLVIRNESKAYVTNANGDLVEVTNPTTAADLDNVGMVELNPSYAAISALTGEIRLVSNEAVTCTLTNIPLTQIVLPRQLTNISALTTLKRATSSLVTSGAGSIKVGVSIGNGTYHTFNETSGVWELIGNLTNTDADAALLHQKGMTPTALAAVTQAQWALLLNGNAVADIGFAVSLDVTEVADKVTANWVSVVGSSDYWEKCDKSEVKIRWFNDRVVFIPAVAGLYKLAYQLP